MSMHIISGKVASQRICTRFLISHQRLWCSGGGPTGENSLYPVAGLPVFLSPNAGRFIVGVSGSLHQICISQGAFADVHRCLQSQDVMRGVWAWAECNGYVQRKTLYRVDYCDEELREERRSVFDDHAQARQEYNEHKSSGIPGVRFVTFSGYGPLPSLKERTQVEHLFLSCVPELALACFATSMMPNTIDGLWWQEEDRPEVQTVPHGVIFPHRIGFWAENRGG